MFDPVNLQLFELICHLEVSLHQASTRRSAQLLQQLLHDEFLEVGFTNQRLRVAYVPQRGYRFRRTRC